MAYPAAYSATPERIHTLKVTGEIGPEGARVLVDTHEKLTQLGHKCELTLVIDPGEAKAEDKLKTVAS